MTTTQKIANLIAQLPRDIARNAANTALRALTDGSKPAQVLRYLRMKYDVCEGIASRNAGCYEVRR